MLLAHGLCSSFRQGDFFGTRLQNRPDHVAVDSACPPAGSINSACQIFSLLCWAHSVAVQCINIHSDQSRASGGRVWCGGVCVCVFECGEKDGRWGGGSCSQNSAGLHTTSRLSSSSQPPLCRLDLQQKSSLCLTLWRLSTTCTHSWLQLQEDVIWVTLPFHSDYLNNVSITQ